MIWQDFERLRKDFHQIIRENQDNHPLYGFLSFLMEAKSKPALHITIKGDRWKRNIQRLDIQFEGEETVTFHMTELPIFDYEWFLKRPEMLLEHFEKDSQLVNARTLYDDILRRFNEFDANMEGFRKGRGEGFRRFMEINADFDIKWFNKKRQEALIEGALFHERLSVLYTEYQTIVNQPQSAPTPEASVTAPDLIEVELLTIIDDPDISDLTKSDAQDTLDAYRQETVNVKRNPKEENAQLAIQTIRRYYTKTENVTKESDSDGMAHQKLI